MSLLEETTRRVQVSANLGLDGDTMAATARFLEEQLGELSGTRADYEVLAGTAIVGEVKRIEDVSREHLTRVGVSVESVMRHIGSKRSKEHFLEEVERLSRKWREAPAWLLTKIDNVRMSYRIYKKYRLAFEELATAHSFLEDQPKLHLQAIFWILYIYVKNEHAEIDNTL